MLGELFPLIVTEFWGMLLEAMHNGLLGLSYLKKKKIEGERKEKNNLPENEKLLRICCQNSDATMPLLQLRGSCMHE